MLADYRTKFLRHRRTIFLLCGLAIFLFLLIRTGWAAEDSYISFRVVDNFVAGRGLVWDLSERVQVYTDPLFVFLLIAVTAVTHSAFWSSAIVSLGLSLSAYLLLFRRQETPCLLLGIALLVSSKAFMDFQVSGLENPATTLGILAFCWAYRERREPFLLTLIFALTALNRLDSSLLLLPALLTVYFRAGFAVWRPALLGLTPLIAWEAFSLFYYGFPFPNTAYAKLGSGIPLSDLVQQGWKYFQNSIHWDRVTLPVIAAGLIYGFAFGEWPLALGILLGLIYILRIGGDFMSGRFFTAPFTLACALLLRPRAVRWSVAIPATLAVLALSLTDTNPPLTVDSNFYVKKAFPVEYGIADERAFFYKATGLLRWSPCILWPADEFAAYGQGIRKLGVQYNIISNIGAAPYVAGPQVHFIDAAGLGDAFLARIHPDPKERRIGHYIRIVPQGYAETKMTGRNQIADPKLAQLYDHLETVIAGPLFSAARIREIWNFNTGRYRDLTTH